jgi:hypothetical protein
MSLILLISLAIAIPLIGIIGAIAVILARIYLRPRRVTRQDLFDAALAARPPYLASDGRYYSGDGRWWWDGARWQPLQRP